MRPIWVVDDDHSIRWVLQKAISREGIPCEIFSSAAEVLERLETEVRPSTGFGHTHAGAKRTHVVVQGARASARFARHYHDGLLRP